MSCLLEDSDRRIDLHLHPEATLLHSLLLMGMLLQHSTCSNIEILIENDAYTTEGTKTGLFLI